MCINRLPPSIVFGPCLCLQLSPSIVFWPCLWLLVHFVDKLYGIGDKKTFKWKTWEQLPSSSLPLQSFICEVLPGCCCAVSVKGVWVHVPFALGSLLLAFSDGDYWCMHENSWNSLLMPRICLNSTITKDMPVNMHFNTLFQILGFRISDENITVIWYNSVRSVWSRLLCCTCSCLWFLCGISGVSPPPPPHVILF